MANLLAYGTQIVGGGGNSQSGGGHVIVNVSGIELAQEDKLKFAGGLKTTDDSTNGQTIVDDSPTEIEWSVWNTMTEQEKAAIPKALVVNAPGVDGPINVELIKTLWTNPSPSSAFAAQTINLSASDYDIILISARLSVSDYRVTSVAAQKGSSLILSFAYPSSSGSATYSRSFTYQDATHLVAGNGSVAIGTSAAIDTNDAVIPLAIYGIKSSVTVDVSGVISDVSTSADKCMLSDGDSVENRITSTWNGVTFSSSISNGHSSIMRTNNMVTVTGYWSGSVTGNMDVIGTIPVGFRPSNTYIGVGTITVSGISHALYFVNSSGEITQQITTGTATAGTFIFTYPIS